MGLKKYRPLTPTLRYKISADFAEITASKPEKSLIVKTNYSSGGRNDSGKMTMRYIGGGHKKVIRAIDFKRDKDGIEGTVKTIEYDPNRSARIALIFYKDGEKRYIIAPHGLKVDTKIMSGKGAAPEIGNTLLLSEIPLGTIIHNIELRRARVRFYHAAQAHMLSYLPVTASMQYYVCLQVRFV